MEKGNVYKHKKHYDIGTTAMDVKRSSPTQRSDELAQQNTLVPANQSTPRQPSQPGRHCMPSRTKALSSHTTPRSSTSTPAACARPAANSAAEQSNKQRTSIVVELETLLLIPLVSSAAFGYFIRHLRDQEHIVVQRDGRVERQVGASGAVGLIRTASSNGGSTAN